MSNPFSRFGAAVAIVLSLCASASAAATQFVTGTTGPGAFYEFAVPEEWNGQLIVYGHGIVDPGNPVAVPTTQDGFAGLRDALLARSFAVASSSYSENGYALKDAAQRLHQLSGLFVANFGQPSRTYLVGHSLGATAVQMLAERFSGRYDGALAMCGSSAEPSPKCNTWETCGSFSTRTFRACSPAIS